MSRLLHFPGTLLPRLARLALLAPAFLIWPQLAQAAWPERPVRMVVPYAAGGGADNTARAVGQRLSELLGQPFVIENRPGAGGVLGADAVAKAAADGYSLLFDASAFGVNVALRKLPYDPANDFIPISLVVTAPQILLVNAASPYKTLADVIAAAKKSPGKLSFGNAGAATGSHLAAEVMIDQAKIDLLHIPFKGGAPAMTDLIVGTIDLYFANASSALPQITGGKRRPLAVTSRQKIAALPATPTISEAGLNDYEMLEWNGIFLPKNTPKDVVERLAKTVQEAIAEPKLRERLMQSGLNPVGNTPQAFGKFVDSESRRWQALMKTRGIKID